MKKILFLTILLALVVFVDGQILKKIADKAKNKVENAAGNKGNNPADNGAGSNKDSADTTKKQEDVSASNAKSETGPATLKAYSKYDFVPGERMIVFEDFAQDAVGDFPDKWNTNSSAEIVTI